MAEETVEDLEKKEGEPVAEDEANSNQEKEEEDGAGVGHGCEERKRAPRLKLFEHLVRPDGQHERAAPEEESCDG